MKPTPKTFNQSTPNKIGRRGEKNTQKSIGGKLTPGSRGGDLMLSNFLIEKKSTAGKSISIKQDYLEKISRIAFSGNKSPILVIEFQTLKKKMGCEDQWAFIPLSQLKELLEENDLAK